MQLTNRRGLRYPASMEPLNLVILIMIFVCSVVGTGINSAERGFLSPRT